MDIAAIGVGGAGGRVVDRLARELRTGAGSPLGTVHAIDTDTASLDALGKIPRKNRHPVGQFETGGGGTDGDRELAAEIVENERTEIRRAVEDGVPTTVDAIVVAAGLAGGTGSAVTPALVAGLANVYEQPVYTVSILPAERDTDEQRRANTARALTGLEAGATAQIVFDNDAWLRGEHTLETHGDAINAELTERLGELFTVGADSDGAVGEQVIDTRDVMSTLDGGNLVSLGYASRAIADWRGANSSLLDGLKRRVLGDDTDDFERGRAVQRTLAWATRGTMTFECPRGAAARGLVVFRGPPEWLRGDAISKGRERLAERAGIERLRSGDVPAETTGSLDVLVVLAGIGRTTRTDAFNREPTAPADSVPEGTDPEKPNSEAGGADDGAGPEESEGAGADAEPEGEKTADARETNGGEGGADGAGAEDTSETRS